MYKFSEIVLVDCENVGLHHVYIKNALIYYFVSSANQGLDVLSERERIKYVKHNGGRNALDFIIDSELGFLIHHYGKKMSYTIISRDTGFDILCSYWRSRGYYVERRDDARGQDVLTNEEYKKVCNIYHSWTTRKRKKSISELADCLSKSSVGSTRSNTWCNETAHKLIKNGGRI